jgi:predicted GTPase
MFSFEGHNITFVDTPGFDDSSGSDAKGLEEIARWMSVQ